MAGEETCVSTADTIYIFVALTMVASGDRLQEWQ